MVHLPRGEVMGEVLMGLAITPLGTVVALDWRGCATRLARATLRRWLVARLRGGFPSVGSYRFFAASVAAMGGAFLVGALSQVSDVVWRVTNPIGLGLVVAAVGFGLAMGIASSRAGRRFCKDPSEVEKLLADGTPTGRR